MAIYQMNKEENALVSIDKTKFDAEKIFERKGIQQWLKQDIHILDDQLMVIAEEYGEFEDSSRRIDLLCLDKTGSLVVVEIKRTQGGGHSELQALRYAAMVSTMTFQQLVEAHVKEVIPPTFDNAKNAILQFLGLEEPNEENLPSKDVRITIASADFSTEVTSSALWLRDYLIDIRCIQMQPYKMADGTILIDVQQLIPLLEVSEYQTKIIEKGSEARTHRNEQLSLVRNFLTELLAKSNEKNKLFEGKKAGDKNYIGIGMGCPGHTLSYNIGRYVSRVDLYIDLVNSPTRRESNLDSLNKLKSHQTEIQKIFGGNLKWEELPKRFACRIRTDDIEGGYGSPRDQWSGIQDNLVDAMERLHKALKQYVPNEPAHGGDAIQSTQ